MPLYLVKWQDGSSALVTAADDDDLVDVLDQLADPGAATWQEYDGPIWLEFPPVAEGRAGPIDPAEIEIGPGRVANADQGSEFSEAVLRLLNPNLAAVRDRAFDEDREITGAELESVRRADAGWALPGSVHGRADDVEH